MKRLLVLAVLVIALTVMSYLYLTERSKVRTLDRDRIAFLANLVRVKGMWNKFLLFDDGSIKWLACKNSDLDWELSKFLNIGDISGQLELTAKLDDSVSGATSVKVAPSSRKWIRVE